MEHVMVIRCSGCLEVVNNYSHLDSINKPHENCPMGGVFKQIAVMASLQQAAPFFINSQVSTAPKRITDVAPETPFTPRNDHAGDRRPSGDGHMRSNSGRGRGRGGGRGAHPTAGDNIVGREAQPSGRDDLGGRGSHASGRGGRGGRGSHASTRGSLADRITQPRSGRSQSPNRRKAIDYRDARSGGRDPRDGGWLPDGSAYMYGGVKYFPESWHKMKLYLPRFTKAEEEFDSWMAYKNNGTSFPDVLDMPHIMPPHPKYGPRLEAKMGKGRKKGSNLQSTSTPKGDESMKPQGTPMSKNNGSKGGNGNAKQDVTKASKASKTLDDIYCISCQSRYHSLVECDATTQNAVWTFPYFDGLPVDMAKFQCESKNYAPVNLAALLEHIFAVRLELEKAVDWCVGRNKIQLKILQECERVEVESDVTPTRSQNLLRRIVQIDIIYEKLFFGINKSIKAFNTLWLGQCKNAGLGLTEPHPTGDIVESHARMVKRFYLHMKDWPFGELEADATKMRNEVHNHFDAYVEAHRRWNRDISRYREDVSLDRDLVTGLDAAELACYSALTDGRAHIRIDRSAWLNFLMVPDVPDDSFEHVIFWDVFIACVQAANQSTGLEVHEEYEPETVEMTGVEDSRNELPGDNADLSEVERRIAA